MTRPRFQVDGSDNRSIIDVTGFRQALTKTTGLGGGNINVDFNSGDTTDNDAGDPPVLPKGDLMEPNQNYLAIISRVAAPGLNLPIICNVNHASNLVGGFLVNVYKLMVVNEPVLYAFRLHSNQNQIRFRFLGLNAADEIKVSLLKMS